MESLHLWSPDDAGILCVTLIELFSAHQCKVAGGNRDCISKLNSDCVRFLIVLDRILFVS